jgi:hypothetical protein
VAAGAFDLADCLLQRRLASGDDDDVRTARGQALGDGLAEAVAAAGDQGALSSQIEQMRSPQFSSSDHGLFGLVIRGLCGDPCW